MGFAGYKEVVTGFQLFFIFGEKILNLLKSHLLSGPLEKDVFRAEVRFSKRLHETM